MIHLFKVFVSREAQREVLKTLKSGYISEGPKVKEFEEKLQKYIDNPYAAVVNSGTSALTLAYKLIDLKSNEYVISVPTTCFAGNSAILAAGGKILWTDIDPKTGLIDPDKLITTIKNFNKAQAPTKIKAISYVTWGGFSPDLEAIEKIADEFNLWIVEDNAHSLGTKYNNKILGYPSKRKFSCFSFQAIKILTMGDGGLIACPNQEFYERATLLRWFGLDRNQKGLDKWLRDIKESGMKYHANDIAASIGLGNFHHLNSILSKMRERGEIYDEKFSNLTNGIVPLQQIPNTEPSYWLYTLLVQNRPKFIDYMKSKDIEVDLVHTDNRIYSCLKRFTNNNLPGCDQFEKEHICLPNHWAITTEEYKHIIKCIQEFSND